MKKYEREFVAAFHALQIDAADTNLKNGFTTEDALVVELEKYLYKSVPEPDNIHFKPLIDSFRNARKGLKLMLAVGELAETLEAVRKNVGPDKHIPAFTAEEAEIADCVIRLMNYATDRHLRLAEAIVAKNEYNRNREDHSAAGRAEVHGKRF